MHQHAALAVGKLIEPAVQKLLGELYDLLIHDAPPYFCLWFGFWRRWPHWERLTGQLFRPFSLKELLFVAPPISGF